MKNLSRKMFVVLWVAQGLLAVMFMMTGLIKITMPIDTLSVILPWTPIIPLWLTRFIGICEVAGGIGLVMPTLFRIKPILTAWAAASLATVMLIATLFHMTTGYANMIGINLILGGVALFVAWKRFTCKLFTPKPETHPHYLIKDPEYWYLRDQNLL